MEPSGRRSGARERKRRGHDHIRRGLVVLLLIGAVGCARFALRAPARGASGTTVAAV